MVPYNLVIPVIDLIQDTAGNPEKRRSLIQGGTLDSLIDYLINDLSQH